MKAKTVCKLWVDVLMTLALLFLMGYQFFGETAHEWAGAGMFVLFLGHHFLNLHWHKNLAKGRYTPLRTVMLVVDLLVLLAMLALMYSGIVLSRHVFAFLSIQSGLALARRLHILGAYWGFVLMSAHLGLHWGSILAMVKKRQGSGKPNRAKSAAAFLASALVAVYGAAAFFRRGIASYLLLQNEFVFLDYSEPKARFYLDYLAIMGLWVFLAHYGTKLLRRKV